jgi:hypothetical protein
MSRLSPSSKLDVSPGYHKVTVSFYTVISNHVKHGLLCSLENNGGLTGPRFSPEMCDRSGVHGAVRMEVSLEHSVGEPASGTQVSELEEPSESTQLLLPVKSMEEISVEVTMLDCHQSLIKMGEVSVEVVMLG